MRTRLKPRVPVLLAILCFPASAADNLADVRAAVRRGTGVVTLPPGETTLTVAIVAPEGSRQLTIRGNPGGSVLRLGAGFAGKAAIVADRVTGLTLERFSIVGDRAELKSSWGLPEREAPFADYYPANGVLVTGSRGVALRNLKFSRVRTFPVIVSASEDVHIRGVRIEDCGSLNPEGKNNTSGGILLEEGVSNFEVRDSVILRITGNGIWTHSYARSRRSADGVIAGNTIEGSARDAIQVGHATRVRVTGNHGSKIGFPSDQIDFAGFGTPVAVDTAGNVDDSAYVGNSFTDVDGQCIDLDGFHDGEVRENSCVNRQGIEAYPGLHFGILFGNHDPGMESKNVRVVGNTIDGFAYGGVFLIGAGHWIENNRFLNVNMARCGEAPGTARCSYAPEQPDLLKSGIYLGKDGGRPVVTRGNVIRGNTIQAFRCVGGELSDNTVESNVCER